MKEKEWDSLLWKKEKEARIELLDQEHHLDEEEQETEENDVYASSINFIRETRLNFNRSKDSGLQHAWQMRWSNKTIALSFVLRLSHKDIPLLLSQDKN